MKYKYAVAMVPTALNGEEMRILQAAGKTLQAIFDDPVEASAYAMEEEWWPFIVERIPHLNLREELDKAANTSPDSSNFVG